MCMVSFPLLVTIYVYSIMFSKRYSHNPLNCFKSLLSDVLSALSLFFRKCFSKTSDVLSRKKWKVCCSPKSFLWTIIKGFIFVCCLSCLCYQTAQFYRIYITYPTTINTEVIRNEPFILPAVTFCYKNTLPRTVFCADFPHLCQKPKNVFKFCHKQPHFCKGNVSSLVIPKLGYYANYSSEVHKIAEEYLFNNTSEVPPYLEGHRMRISYVESEQEDVFAKCFSERLQLFHGEVALKTAKIDLSLFSDNVIGMYKLYISESESLYPWDRNRVFFAVHSPFMPINPLYEGIAIRPGYQYFVEVRLHKDYLLPYPYKTDCVNYNITWMKNNRSGPRSQDACKELCRSVFLKDCFGCDPGRIMIEDPADLCTPGTKLRRPYYFWRYFATWQGRIDIKGIPQYLNVCLPYVEAHQRCHDGCKPDCVKLHFDYNVVESAEDPSPMKPFEANENEAEIQIYVKKS
ncbi:hypothetical protein HNY73_013757 [Argiope bruennichi]|uniref:Uncharacterized protein n=1 Tax=Argiope bruennichi TaxID=94029 RepID=A0A8T0ELN0_ARGBR|nr:hypothetical protein HNY73_013757 [Argiope bruennichi]